MNDARLLLYASSNGDRWWLCRGNEPADVFVLHEPNVPSGGLASRVEIGRFLCDSPAGPQHHELLRLLGSSITERECVAAIDGPGPEAGAATAEPTPGEGSL
jgi:hypothetical protein